MKDSNRETLQNSNDLLSTYLVADLTFDQDDVVWLCLATSVDNAKVDVERMVHGTIQWCTLYSMSRVWERPLQLLISTIVVCFNRPERNCASANTVPLLMKEQFSLLAPHCTDCNVMEEGALLLS